MALQQAARPLVWHVSRITYSVIGASFAYFAVDLAVIMRTPRISRRVRARQAAWHAAAAAGSGGALLQLRALHFAECRAPPASHRPRWCRHCSPAILLHHGVALLSLATAARVRALHAFLAAIMLSEATTPSVNARWWLEQAEAKAGRLYAANGLLLLATWTVARIAIVIPFYVAVAANAADMAAVPLHARALLLLVPALLWCLNVLWWLRIVRGAAKLLRRRGAADASGGHADVDAPMAGCGAEAAASVVVPSAELPGNPRKRMVVVGSPPRRAVEVVAYAHPVPGL